LSAGADLVSGDLGDTASVLKAASSVGTVFLMGNSNEVGTEEETRQGIIAAEAAKDAGVEHLIYSSVADANKKTGIPHFESKYLVEKHVAGLGIPYTIDRVGADADIAALRRDFSRSAGTVLQTGRASLTGAFLNGRLLSPEVATRIIGR
jgi:uncharacterized protein YbjT (DUF2867 family)